MEESPVSSDEVVGLASGLILYVISIIELAIAISISRIEICSYCNVDLTLEHILGLLVVVRAESCRSRHNAVESSGQVWGRV